MHCALSKIRRISHTRSMITINTIIFSYNSFFGMTWHKHILNLHALLTHSFYKYLPCTNCKICKVRISRLIFPSYGKNTLKYFLKESTFRQD